jgi:hypothetical protein
MVKAFAKTNTGRLICMLGLSDGNLARLRAGHPIFVDLKTVLTGSPLGDIPVEHIFISWGETEEDIAHEWLKLMGPDTQVIHGAAPNGSPP